MNTLCFDIETGSEVDTVLESFFTFDDTKVKNYDLLGKRFDPAEVRCGNLKDATKIQQKIAESQQKFEAAKEAVAENIAIARAEAWQEFKDKAALSPLTGQVLAIGWLNPEDSAYVYDFISNDSVAPVSEKELIEHFLSLADAVLSDGGRLMGHNIIGFDLPFLLRRGLKYGIRPPKTITNALVQFRATNLIDTQREWAMGGRTTEFIALDKLAMFFGARRKTGDGKDFSKLFFGSIEEKEKALNYLENDVRMTFEIATKMRLID